MTISGKIIEIYIQWVKIYLSFQFMSGGFFCIKSFWCSKLRETQRPVMYYLTQIYLTWIIKISPIVLIVLCNLDLVLKPLDPVLVHGFCHIQRIHPIAGKRLAFYF